MSKKDSKGREIDFIIFDEAEDLLKEGEPFEFSCIHRNKTDDGCWYVVEPLEEYEDLNFEGHTVVINGRERLCNRFNVSDDGIISILVRSNAST